MIWLSNVKEKLLWPIVYALLSAVLRSI